MYATESKCLHVCYNESSHRTLLSMAPNTVSGRLLLRALPLRIVGLDVPYRLTHWMPNLAISSNGSIFVHSSKPAIESALSQSTLTLQLCVRGSWLFAVANLSVESSRSSADPMETALAYNMVFTQGRGFVLGTSFGLQVRSLRCRVSVCDGADTASLATWFLFGKLFECQDACWLRLEAVS